MSIVFAPRTCLSLGILAAALHFPTQVRAQGTIPGIPTNPLDANTSGLIKDALAMINSDDPSRAATLLLMYTNGEIVCMPGVVVDAIKTSGQHDGNTIAVDCRLRTIGDMAAHLLHELNHIENTGGGDGEKDPTTNPSGSPGGAGAKANHAAICEAAADRLCAMSCNASNPHPVFCDDIKDHYRKAANLYVQAGDKDGEIQAKSKLVGTPYECCCVSHL